MRDLFPGHYRLSDEKTRELWENATFVFDSNVLLNLYSYPELARTEFFSVLNKIQKEIWIPYQVALEFHKNRFNRIRASNDSVEKLRTKLKRAHGDLAEDFEKIEFDKRNTGVADLADRITSAKRAYEQLENAIDLVCDRLPKTSLEDPIGQEIADLFSGKVGIRPKNQDEIDNLVADGEKRYSNEIPPGFMDKSKNENHIDGDTIYPAKFGDLIIWKQTIAHIKETKKKNVIFITGDRKDDWWWSEKGETIGPHPRLISEFLEKSEAEKFWIYTSDKFLEYANNFLQGINVSKDSIEQVKNASDHQQSVEEKPTETGWETAYKALEKFIQANQTNTQSRKLKDIIIKKGVENNTFSNSTRKINSAIANWIRTLYPENEVTTSKKVDFLVSDEWNTIAAFEIMENYEPNIFSICEKITELGEIDEPHKTLIVIINTSNFSQMKEIINVQEELINKTILLSGIYKIIFGFIIRNSFTPAKEFCGL